MCAGCPGRCPDLLPENGPVWELWRAVSGQWRVGARGPFGLDYPAVYLVAETLGVEMTPANLRRLRSLENETCSMARKGKS